MSTPEYKDNGSLEVLAGLDTVQVARKSVIITGGMWNLITNTHVQCNSSNYQEQAVWEKHMLWLSSRRGECNTLSITRDSRTDLGLFSRAFVTIADYNDVAGRTTEAELSPCVRGHIRHI